MRGARGAGRRRRSCGSRAARSSPASCRTRRTTWSAGSAIAAVGRAATPRCRRSGSPSSEARDVAAYLYTLEVSAMRTIDAARAFIAPAACVVAACGGGRGRRLRRPRSRRRGRTAGARHRARRARRTSSSSPTLPNGEWTHAVGRLRAALRYSPLDQITTANVKNLRVDRRRCRPASRTGTKGSRSSSTTRCTS